MILGVARTAQARRLASVLPTSSARLPRAFATRTERALGVLSRSDESPLQRFDPQIHRPAELGESLLPNRKQGQPWISAGRGGELARHGAAPLLSLYSINRCGGQSATAVKVAFSYVRQPVEVRGSLRVGLTRWQIPHQSEREVRQDATGKIDPAKSLFAGGGHLFAWLAGILHGWFGLRHHFRCLVR